MDLDPGQQIRMSLGGTQPLPPVSLDKGTIKWASATQTKDQDSLVEITLERTPSHAVIWMVRLGDLTAIESRFLVEDSVGKREEREWHVGPDVTTALNDTSKVLEGTAFVREEAQTLLRLEHGVSAVASTQIVASGLPVASRESDDEFEINCEEC